MGERPIAVIATQQKYIFSSVAERLSLSDQLTLWMATVSRNLSFGSIPHLGAKYLAAELYVKGFEPHIVNLDPKYDEELKEWTRIASLLAVSAMDISLDRAEAVFLEHQYQLPVIGGGYAITANVDRLTTEYPEVTFVPGDAEGVFAVALQHLLDRGYMEPVYRRESPFDMVNFEEVPYANDEVFEQIKHVGGYSPIKVTQATKGCTEGCFFCPTAGCEKSVKPLDIQIRELERQKINRFREIAFFVDQNLLVASDDYLLGLLDFINRRKVHFWAEGIRPEMGQGQMNETLMRAMGRNCDVLLIGPEEIGNVVPGSATKTALSKGDNLQRLTGNMKQAGVPVLWSLVFGSDQQAKGYGSYAAEKVLANNMNIAPHILTLREGNSWSAKLKRQGRWLDDGKDSSKRNMGTIGHEPALMTADEAVFEYLVFLEKVFSWEAIKRRFEENLKYLSYRQAVILRVIDTGYHMSRSKAMIQYPEIAKQLRRE